MNIPKYLKWNNTIYEYSNNKHGILIYSQEGICRFGELEETGKIIIVEHRKNKPFIDSFYVLFSMDSGYYKPSISLHNISKISNRIAKPYKINEK